MITCKQLLIFLSIVLIGISGTLTYHYGYVVAKVIDVPVSVEVRPDNVFGFNTESTSLNFGKVPARQKQARYLDVTNDYSFPVTLDHRVRGELGQYALVTPAEATLDPGQSITFKVQLIAPPEVGQYNSTLRIFVKRT